ncbi:hypothetical protein [Ancylobacter novellus]|uniref:hypothetical protein n=1 Tax=Ancylobacter novellus TaxID=921 RepID=UPI00031C6F42|nr:hypothetical protein [Ancylobacter novellus]
MTKTSTAAILSAFISLATLSGAHAAEVRDPAEVAGYKAAIASASAFRAPAVVEGRNATVSARSGIAANAERAIENAERQVRR